VLKILLSAGIGNTSGKVCIVGSVFYCTILPYYAYKKYMLREIPKSRR
jgi:hypothetical protein